MKDEETTGGSPTQDLRPLLRLFVRNGELTEALYAAAIKAAIKVVSPEKPVNPADPPDEVKDFAMDLLVNHVLAGGITEISSISGFVVEATRYRARHANPEESELWSVLSEAMRNLATEGKARRLDANLTENNHNKALWVGQCTDSAAARLDMGELRRRSAGIPTFYPSRNEGRIIAPQEAEKLILLMLSAAQAPITFGLLFAEAANHVVFGLRHHVEEQEGEDSEGEERPPLVERIAGANDEMFWLKGEAGARAGRIWAGSGQIGDGQKILCLYVIPKHFIGSRVAMSSLGSPQRINEITTPLMRLLASGLSVESLAQERHEAGNASLQAVVTELVGLVTRLLMEKCSENGWDAHFSTGEAAQLGGNKND